KRAWPASGPHLLDENTFTQNFRNDHNPSKTYLCYQVELSQDLPPPPPPPPRIDCQCRNPSVPLLCQGGGGQHAEWFLLEHIRSRNLDQKLSYKVTCFLSWTPCEKCAKEIIRFLAKNRHVSLSILASRIYTMGPYVKGLRELYDAGVHISIMTFRDFEYCWQTFVDHQDSPFQPWADLDRRSQQLSQQLRAILQVSHTGSQGNNYFSERKPTCPVFSDNSPHTLSHSRVK
uniref:DNA dC->dU-editing enzyme APOBEC-3G n=1 Tax=Canis lupus dingo TaxID=286419 RepID=A0A8C0JQE3_CANLU